MWLAYGKLQRLAFGVVSGKVLSGDNQGMLANSGLPGQAER